MNTNSNSVWWVDAETLDYMDNVVSLHATNTKLSLEFESIGKAVGCYMNILSNIDQCDWYMVKPTTPTLYVDMYRPKLLPGNIDVDILEVVTNGDYNCIEYRYKVEGLFYIEVTNYNDGVADNGVVTNIVMLDRANLWSVECGIYFWNEILPFIAKQTRTQESQLMYAIATHEVLDKLHYN